MRVDPDTCRDPVLLAAEVRRLQAVIAASETLTDEEREAVAWFSNYSDTPGEEPHAVVLAKLLERTK
jgi:hypothetical protein